MLTLNLVSFFLLLSNRKNAIFQCERNVLHNQCGSEKNENKKSKVIQSDLNKCFFLTFIHQKTPINYATGGKIESERNSEQKIEIKF